MVIAWKIWVKDYLFSFKRALGVSFSQGFEEAKMASLLFFYKMVSLLSQPKAGAMTIDWSPFLAPGGDCEL